MRFVVIIILFILTLSLVYFYISKTSTNNEGYLRIKVNDIVVNAEIANTDAEKINGLTNKTNLEENQGMLFVFSEEDYYGFWMKNMKIPIDMIFIDKDNTVIDIWKDAQPCKENCTSYVSKEKSMYVLEVKSNFTDRHNVTIGSKIFF